MNVTVKTTHDLHPQFLVWIGRALESNRYGRLEAVLRFFPRTSNLHIGFFRLNVSDCTYNLVLLEFN